MKARILVVDDDASIRKILTTQLRRAGYAVFDAPDALQALDLLAAEPIDLILSDVMMPRMDGLEFRRRLLEIDELAHVPFVLLTAKKETTDKIASYDLDVAAYFTKPFESQEVMARIASLLRLQDGRSQFTKAQRLRAIRQLTVTLNHEINNPLSTVIGQAELLLRKDDLPEAERARRMIDEIRKAGYRIQEVIAKINRIRQIATKTYLSNIEMVDLERAGQEGEGSRPDLPAQDS